MFVSTIAALKLITTRPVIQPKVQNNHRVTQNIGPLEPGPHTVAVCHNNSRTITNSLNEAISAYTNSPAEDATENVNQFLTKLQQIPGVFFAGITTDESASNDKCKQSNGKLDFIDINIPSTNGQPVDPFAPTDEGSDISRLLKINNKS